MATLAAVSNGPESLPVERCLMIHHIMVQARTMEQRMIRISKSGEGYFWIGGPGEEAFNVCLGLQAKKGCGPTGYAEAGHAARWRFHDQFHQWHRRTHLDAAH